MKLFITSNQQFGRVGAIKAYSRPFSDVNEMNEHLIKQWNSVVGEEDTVFVLGNFAWQPEIAEVCLSRLNGNKVHVMDGEWDKATHELVKTSKIPGIHHLTEGIRSLTYIKASLSYWPLQDWPRKKEGAISFIGHPGKTYKTDHKKRIVNVTCDRWDFKPVNAIDLVKLYDDPDLSEKK